MEKRELKFYEAPAMEVVEMEPATSLLATSGDDYIPTPDLGEEE